MHSVGNNVATYVIAVNEQAIIISTFISILSCFVQRDLHILLQFEIKNTCNNYEKKRNPSIYLFLKLLYIKNKCSFEKFQQACILIYCFNENAFLCRGKILYYIWKHHCSIIDNFIILEQKVSIEISKTAKRIALIIQLCISIFKCN